jgi:hypothetical protein
MIASRLIWGIIQEHAPRKQWVSSEDIYTIVELHGNLDDEDRRQSPRSNAPIWKSRVRNVLATHLSKGGIRSRKRSDNVDGFGELGS